MKYAIILICALAASTISITVEAGPIRRVGESLRAVVARVSDVTPRPRQLLRKVRERRRETGPRCSG